jgi:hypothetical protein
MGIWSGYAGLTVGFLAIASILLWFLITTRGRVVIKTTLIFLTVWYGFVLYYSLENFTGWPTPQAVPHNSRLLALRVNEPDSNRNEPGGIYLWVTSGQDSAKGLSLIHPRNLFKNVHSSEPRSHKLPYDRELHKALLQAQAKMEGIPGAEMNIRKSRDKRQKGKIDGDEQSRAPLEFEILNPSTMLPKSLPPPAPPSSP